MNATLISDVIFGTASNGMSENQNEMDHMGSRFIQLILTVYGPYAFGVASLLIIWFSIVSPQLQSQAVDYKKNEEVVTSLRSIITSQEQVARTLERTAIVLDQLVEQIRDHAAQDSSVPR